MINGRINNIKKYCTVILALIFVSSTLLCGCGKTNDEYASETNASTEPSETVEGEVKDYPEDLSLNWGTGEVKLKQYMIAKSEGKDILVLYFDYTNLADETHYMMEELSVDVFQKKVQIDNNFGLAVASETEDSLKQIQKGASITGSVETVLPNTVDPLTIRLRAYDPNSEVVSVEGALQLSDAGSNDGDSIYAEKSDLETTLKDGASINWGNGEVTLTGYNIGTEGSDYITLYFDYTNFDDEYHNFIEEVTITPFQDGIELDYYQGEIDFDVYNRIFSSIKDGGKVHCALTFVIDKSKGNVIVQMKSYDADYNEVKAEQEISIK